MNILQDIKTAANVFGGIRKARKAGADGFWVRTVWSVPVYRMGLLGRNYGRVPVLRPEAAAHPGRVW